MRWLSAYDANFASYITRSQQIAAYIDSIMYILINYIVSRKRIASNIPIDLLCILVGLLKRCAYAMCYYFKIIVELI